MSNLKCPNIKIYKCSDGFVTDNAQVAKSHEANIKSNKLICPFCQQEIHKDSDGYYTCYTDNCGCMKHGGNGASGSESLWLTLIRTRKALEVAVDALKEYADRDNWGMGFAPWLEDGFKDALYTEDGYKTAEKALEQITTLKQKESAFVHNKIEFPEFNDNLLEEFDKQFFEDGQDDD